MRRSIRIRIAHAMGRHMVRVMPAARSDWAAGMQAEIAAIENPGAALAFAFGCVGVGYGRRLRSVSGALAMTRWAVAAATLVFAALVLINANWSWGQVRLGALPLVFTALGLAFLIAGLALARSAFRSLVGVAAMMLALNTIGLWVISRPTVDHDDVYRALVIEGYLLWSALLVAGLVLRHAARSTRLIGLARARGWDA